MLTGPYYFASVMIIPQPSSHASPGGCGGTENSSVLKISTTGNISEIENEDLVTVFRDHRHCGNRVGSGRRGEREEEGRGVRGTSLIETWFFENSKIQLPTGKRKKEKNTHTHKKKGKVRKRCVPGTVRNRLARRTILGRIGPIPDVSACKQTCHIHTCFALRQRAAGSYDTCSCAL